MLRTSNRLMSLAGVVLMLAGLCGLGGCATAPNTRAQRSALVDESRTALKLMKERDSDLGRFLDGSAGYAVFPNVGKGGLIVGGAFGRGAVFDANGNLLGYAKVTQGSVGGVIGARTFALLLVFEHTRELERFKDGDDIQFGAEATAVALTEGCSATTRYHNGVAVFAMPRGGLMADASLNGQTFAFEKPEEPLDPRQDPYAPSSPRSGNSATVSMPTD
ncbi:YSC84-related protein [Fontivita pretiosa]|uniref:lipid-binding SYLF domain-containing protein n=1 Tax=Fontivita pretiosa TaxID=2989684 RepID=UPI003D183084